jgi:hypothetical protein
MPAPAARRMDTGYPMEPGEQPLRVEMPIALRFDAARL